MLTAVQPDELSSEERAVLALAMGNPSEARLIELLASYRDLPERQLWRAGVAGRAVGVMGTHIESEGTVRVGHIAVAPAEQGRGFGRGMLEALMQQGLRIVLETDSNGSDFYRACGFAVTSLGEKYPGVERFECSWTESS